MYMCRKGCAPKWRREEMVICMQFSMSHKTFTSAVVIFGSNVGVTVGMVEDAYHGMHV